MNNNVLRWKSQCEWDTAKMNYDYDGETMYEDTASRKDVTQDDRQRNL